jgi:YesN/AraC family two-component response regulator
VPSLGIHLMITDVVMPGLSGKQLAAQLAETRPELKVLYISGYTSNVIAHRGILDADVQFLSKPFTREQLAGKVREILDSGPEREDGGKPV